MDMGILDFKGVRYKGQEQFIEFFFLDWGFRIQIGYVGVCIKLWTDGM